MSKLRTPWGRPIARILLRHLLPATAGFLLSIETMMVPAFVVSEGTLTLVGLGFPVPAASWGAMLRDAWQGSAFTDAPWLMSPAIALALTVLLMHMLSSGDPLRLPPSAQSRKSLLKRALGTTSCVPKPDLWLTLEQSGASTGFSKVKPRPGSKTCVACARTSHETARVCATSA